MSKVAIEGNALGTGTLTIAAPNTNTNRTLTIPDEAGTLSLVSQLVAINAIINGNFGINQRGVSGTVTLTAGVYGHDRWKAGSGGCTYTFATSANVTTLTITAGTLIQVIEGLNLASGTYTLSFTGTAQGKIGAGSFAASGVTGAAVGGTNLNIEFNTGTVSLVQFEQGSVATPFERRPFGAELSLCQRYYYRNAPASANKYLVTTAWANQTFTAFALVQFPVIMRTSPSALEQTGIAGDYAVFLANSATTCSSVPTFNAASVYNSLINLTVPSGLTVGQAGTVRSTGTAGHLGFSAEL